MRRLIVILILAFSIFHYQLSIAFATVLSDAASALPVGQWTKITTNNIAVPSQAFANLTDQVSFPGYDDNVAAWNSVKKQFYFVSTSDPQLRANGNTPLVIYDDTTNNWTTGATPGSALGEGFHGYDGVAWDNTNEVLYYRPGLYGGTKIYRYCVNNAPAWCVGHQGAWTLLPNPVSAGGCYQIGNALTFHATMDGGSLLCYDGELGIQQFGESTGTWSGILPGTHVSGTGSYHVCAEYNPISQVTVFGCGGGTAMYKIDNNKTVTQLADAPSPLNLGIVAHDIVADPTTGDFIAVIGYAAHQGRLYRLNPTGTGTWTLLDNDLNTAGKICESYHDNSAGCSGDFYGASVPTYGVIMYWKYLTPTTGEVWLYRPSAGGGGAGGGADFATRCIGALFCNGFDTVGDLGGDGWGNARGHGPADGTVNCGVNNCPTIDTTTKVSGAGAIKFTIPPGATGNAAGTYWANPSVDFSVRFGANQTYYVQFRQKITASYFPAILTDNDKIHWVSTRPDLPGCTPSTTAGGNCFASCTENELVNQNLYGVASDALPRWYNGCPGPNSFQYVEPVTPGYLKLQNARTGVGCNYDNVAAGNRFPPSGNCFPYYPDQWVTYSYKISLGSLGTGGVGGLCYDGSNPGSITPNLQNCYYGSQIVARMGLDGQPLEEVLNWTGPVIAKDQTNPTELKYGKVWFSPYTGTATIPSGAAMWFDELIISTQPIADPSGSTPVSPANVTLTRRRIQ